MQNTLYAKDSRLSGTSKIVEYHISLFTTVIRLLIGKDQLSFCFLGCLRVKILKNQLSISELFSIMSLQEYQSQIFYIQDL